MRGWPPLDRAEANAMRLPSGDHAGAASSAGLFVRLIALLDADPESAGEGTPRPAGSAPSAFTRKVSPLSANAICLPSGDHEGRVAASPPCGPPRQPHPPPAAP